MDDTFVVLNLSVLTQQRQSIAVVWHELFHMYDGAGLEVEPESFGCLGNVLQSSLLVGHGVQCMFWNKNATFSTTGQQKVRRLLPAFTQSKQRQRALLSGFFHRMEAANFPKCVSALLPALFQLEAEVIAFGYSAAMFSQCFETFAHSHVHDHRLAWIRLCHAFKQGSVVEHFMMHPLESESC
jgi:hypothetical protein